MLDLHMHSSHSIDGSFAPETLVRLCAEQGVDIMSLSDHNTVSGVPAAMAEARRLGLRCLPGIEIDCTLNGTDLHMLGYGIDTGDPAFAEIERHAMAQERGASRQKLEGFRQLGFDISEAEMEAVSADCSQPGVWTGEMFAEVLLNRPGLEGHPLLLPYRAGGKRSDNPYVNFYWDFCGSGRPCHTPLRWPDAEAVIRTIHLSGGRAVLAHPGQNLKGSTAGLGVLRELGLDGVEVFSSYHTPAQAADYLAAARQLGLAPTCGSDFHGKTKPSVRLGGYTVPADTDSRALVLAGLRQLGLPA